MVVAPILLRLLQAIKGQSWMNDRCLIKSTNKDVWLIKRETAQFVTLLSLKFVETEARHLDQVPPNEVPLLIKRGGEHVNTKTESEEAL